MKNLFGLGFIIVSWIFLLFAVTHLIHDRRSQVNPNIKLSVLALIIGFMIIVML